MFDITLSKKVWHVEPRTHLNTNKFSMFSEEMFRCERQAKVNVPQRTFSGTSGTAKMFQIFILSIRINRKNQTNATNAANL